MDCSSTLQWKRWATVLLVVMLGACGGGGGGGGSSPAEGDSPAPPEPDPQPVAVQLTSARSLSPHYIEVSFDQPVSMADVAPADFSLQDVQGNPVEIGEILPTGDENSARLVVSPGLVMPLEEYSLTHPSLSGEEIALVGQPAVEPRLESAVTLSVTELLLTFDSEMSQDSVQNPDAYRIIPLLDGAPEPGVAPLQVVKMELLADQRRLILTTGPQDNREYRVVVKNIANVTNTYVNPDFSRSTIVGMGEDDTRAPDILAAQFDNSNQLAISFSEPVCRTGGNPTNYTVKYCVPSADSDSCAANADQFQAFVNQVELDEFCTAATLSTSFIPEGAVISVNVNNVIDNTGNVLDGGTVIRPQLPGKDDSVKPRLSSAIALSANEVLLTFDKVLSEQSANDRRFYRIIAAEGGSARIEQGELGINSASLQDDGRTVLLGTSVQDVREYLLRATNIANQAGDAYIDPEYSTAIFFGRGSVETDTTPPEITRVSQGGSSTIYTEFSEPLCDTAGDETLYQLRYCLPVEGASTCSGNAELPVTRVELNEHCTRATINTTEIPANAILSLRISGLADSAGNGVVGGDQSVTVPTYAAPADDTAGAIPPPVVVGAISRGNTSVQVVFSQAMADSAAVAGNYVVTQQNVNGESGSLSVTGATFTGPARTTVELTTLSQNDVTYQLTVVGAEDSQGQPMRVQATNVGFVTANTAVFAGIPPNGGSVVDTDGDGLTDNEEQRGWQISIVNANGQVVSREVSSDPFTADTDGDGLDDRVERGLNSDPRNTDSDSDGLADAHEYNGIFTSPTNQDGDGDGLTDGEEVNFYRTSPLLSDTDGDQIPDSDEVVLANRNARVADLPQPVFEIESIALELDVRFDETTSEGTTQGTTETVASTLTQSNSRTRSRTSEVNDKVSASITAKTQYELGGDAGVGKLTAGLEVTAGYEHSWSSSWSDESTNATLDEYNESLESAREFTEDSSVSRVVEAARISTLLYLSAEGDVAFTLRDLQITALVDDIRNPGQYLPVATLVPDEATQNVFNLGPLVDSIGPLVFSARDVFPAQVERLMQNPSGVIFKISNYNIEDESGRNFAFSSQEVTDRTTSLSIDFGGEPATEYYRVATSFGRNIGSVVDEIALRENISPVEVRRSYGLASDDDDSLVAYDLSGNNLGVVFHDVMQEVLGLARLDAASDNATGALLENSYATALDGNGVERITRIRQQRNGERKNWSVLSPSGLILYGQLSFGSGDVQPDDQVLFPGTGISLAFVQDLDNDKIPARLESLHGCSDSLPDSDGDGLDDYFEVFGEPRTTSGGRVNPGNVWRIELAESSDYEGFSSCSAEDTDHDGLSDVEEHSLANGYRTDAKKPDTDGDGVTDLEEIEGFVTYLEDDSGDLGACVDYNGEGTGAGTGIPAWSSAHPSKRAVRCVTDPLDRDTDDDGIKDGAESRFFANPTVDDFDDVADLDGDGLLGFEETYGWDVTVVRFPSLLPPVTCSPVLPVSAACNSAFAGVLPTSDPVDPDTDGDSLRDDEEFAAGTHPRVSDTDKDFLSDFDEVLGETLGPENGPGETNTIPIETDPLHWDTDGDTVADGLELQGWDVTYVDGNGSQQTYFVYSDPVDDNSDSDDLDDLYEYTYKTDPRNANTDGDSFGLSDADEIALGTDPLDAVDICVKVTFTNISASTADDLRVNLDVVEIDNASESYTYSKRASAGNEGESIYALLNRQRSIRVQAHGAQVEVAGTWRSSPNGNQSTTHAYNDFTIDDLQAGGDVTFDEFTLAAASRLYVSWSVDVLTPPDVVDGETYCGG